mmetsp:Transcript_41088/g.86025  ORF Transcript_41088/g.86025 Transcript_41088/m.86025 type:complete len:257 (+) Transcript_41088:169-939(+)
MPLGIARQRSCSAAARRRARSWRRRLRVRKRTRAMARIAAPMEREMAELRRALSSLRTRRMASTLRAEGQTVWIAKLTFTKMQFTAMLTPKILLLPVLLKLMLPLMLRFLPLLMAAISATMAMMPPLPSLQTRTLTQTTRSTWPLRARACATRCTPMHAIASRYSSRSSPRSASRCIFWQTMHTRLRRGSRPRARRLLLLSRSSRPRRSSSFRQRKRRRAGGAPSAKETMCPTTRRHNRATGQAPNHRRPRNSILH